MFKKTLSFFLFSVAIVVPALSYADFPDVFSSNPYWNAIDYVQQKGIVGGYPSGNFGPNNSVNRAEFVKILVKTMYTEDQISKCTGASFDDVAADAWYAPYVCMAQQFHIVDGYPDKTFQPENPISFAEAAKILRNTLLANELIVPAKDYDDWYGIYVDALSQKGAIPVSINGFDAKVTRSEIAEMIYRLDAKLTVLPSLTIDEMNDHKLIDTYYSEISDHTQDLDKAYAMKAEPDMSLAAFKTLYKDFPYAFVDGTTFKKTALHTYEFEVKTLPNLEADSEKGASEYYKVKMQIIGGKLNTIFSELLTKHMLEEVSNEAADAWIDWYDGSYRIFVHQNGLNELAVEYNTADHISVNVNNLRFSPGGKYLVYELYDWEFAGIGVYDIANKTHQIYGGIDVYGFTPDDDKFYFCAESGMSGGEVTVTDLPGFDNVTTVVDLKKGSISSCGPYDADTQTLHYETVPLTEEHPTPLKGTYQIK